MSSTQGKILVSLVAVVPPAVAASVYFWHPVRLGFLSWALLSPILYLWFQYVRKTTWRYFNHPLRHLAQAPGEAFFNGHWSANFEKPRGVAYQRWLDNVPNDGLIYFRGPLHIFPACFLTSVEAMQEMFVTNAYDFEKIPADTWLLELFIGRGLIVVEGAEHKAQRKSVTPAFSGKHINDLVPTFQSKAKEFADVIAGQLDHVPGDGRGRTGIVEINQWASRVTLDIIGLACVGRDFMSLYNSDDEIAQQYEKIFASDHGNVVLFALMSVWLPLHVARWQPFSRRVREAADGRWRLRALCRRLIEIKRKDMETESEKHIDILSVLMRSGQFMDDGLVDQLLTFLAAGHETTSGSLAWTLWLLSTHPSCQARLREELTDFASANPDGLNSVSALDSLPYLNAVISEQLRLYPNVPLTGRHAVKDTSLLGHFIPKGTILLASPWAVSRSRTFWGADAEVFRPERWLVSDKGQLGTGKGPMSLITFIHGPRSCIGQAFSRAELRCLVAAMIVKFDVQVADPTEKIEPGGLVAIKPANGLRLRLREIS